MSGLLSVKLNNLALCALACVQYMKKSEEATVSGRTYNEQIIRGNLQNGRVLS